MTLSTPILWIFLPLLAALIALAFGKRRVFGILFTSITSFGLSLLALFFPKSMILSLGPLTLIFEESLSIFGREAIVAYEILPFIALIFFMNGLWALSSGLPSVPGNFRPLSLMIVSLMTASFGVEPFLYAALLIETAVLLSIPMLSPLGQRPQAGVLRYLTLQTLAMPLILLAGWLLTGVEALPPDSPLVFQSALALGLGIALWLAVFPFHSWVPMVSQRSHPLVTSFLLFIIPTTVLLFSLNFLNRYTFLRDSAALYTTLRIIGALMIVIGGAWTAIQTHLKRAMGFAALTETGFSLLAIGLAADGGLDWMLMLFPARALAFWLWGSLLTRVETTTGDSDLKHVKGFARRYPIFAFSLILVQFSVAGMPLLAEFPVKISLLTAAFKSSAALGAWAFVGSLGLFLFTLRLLATLVTPENSDADPGWALGEKLGEYLPILFMLAVLVACGLFPHKLLDGITNILTVFGQLQ